MILSWQHRSTPRSHICAIRFLCNIKYYKPSWNFAAVTNIKMRNNFICSCMIHFLFEWTYMYKLVNTNDTLSEKSNSFWRFAGVIHWPNARQHYTTWTQVRSVCRRFAVVRLLNPQRRTFAYGNLWLKWMTSKCGQRPISWRSGSGTLQFNTPGWGKRTGFVCLCVCKFFDSKTQVMFFVSCFVPSEPI